MRRSAVCTTARFAPPNRRRTRRARLRHLLRCFAARNGASLSDDVRGVRSNSRRWSTETARFCRAVYERDQRLSREQSPPATSQQPVRLVPFLARFGLEIDERFQHFLEDAAIFAIARVVSG